MLLSRLRYKGEEVARLERLGDGFPSTCQRLREDDYFQQEIFQPTRHKTIDIFIT
jgi:hypothetical protein